MTITQNIEIARKLREVAQLLEDQGANRFRVRAYRAAAETIERLAVPAAEITQQQGTDGLQSLPGIGVSLARSIHTLIVTGRLPMLDRLRGRMDRVDLSTDGRHAFIFDYKTGSSSRYGAVDDPIDAGKRLQLLVSLRPEPDDSPRDRALSQIASPTRAVQNGS